MKTKTCPRCSTGIMIWKWIMIGYGDWFCTNKDCPSKWE